MFFYNQVTKVKLLMNKTLTTEEFLTI